MIPATLLYDAFGQWLHDQGVAVYNADGIYALNLPLPAVFIEGLPDAPDAAIGITIYDHDTRRGDRGNPDIYLQTRIRLPGPDPRPVNDAADQLADILHDQTHITLPGGVHILHAYRTIRGPAVKDDSGQRRERPDSYRLTTNPIRSTP